MQHRLHPLGVQAVSLAQVDNGKPVRCVGLDTSHAEVEPLGVRGSAAVWCQPEAVLTLSSLQSQLHNHLSDV